MFEIRQASYGLLVLFARGKRISTTRQRAEWLWGIAPMKKVVVVFLIVFSLGSVKAQNLVSNGSFEVINMCPDGSLDLGGNTAEWCSNGAELYSTCATIPFLSVPNPQINGLTNIFQVPHSGNNYIGTDVYGKDAMTLQNRETFVQKLANKLVVNQNYCITFYTSNSFVYGNISIDRIGLYLSADTLIPCQIAFSQIQFPTNLPGIYAVPAIESPAGVLLNDSLNWTKISGSYIANGTEQFVTVGCLRPDSLLHTYPIYTDTTWVYTYYFFDDISIVEVQNHIEAGVDTFACVSDSVQIGLPPIDGVAYSWQPQTGLSNPYSSNPKALLSQTTTYVLTTTQCNVVLYDTLTVTVLPNPCTVGGASVIEAKAATSIVPNPNNGAFNLEFTTNITTPTQLQITNAVGQLVDELTLVNKVTNYDNARLQSGVYFYTVTNNNAIIDRGKFIVQK